MSYGKTYSPILVLPFCFLSLGQSICSSFYRFIFLSLSVSLSISTVSDSFLFPTEETSGLKPSPATGRDKPSWVWPEALPWHYGSLDARRNVHPFSVHNLSPPTLALQLSGVLSPEPYALHPHPDSRSEVSPPETSWDLGPFAAMLAT